MELKIGQNLRILVLRNRVLFYKGHITSKVRAYPSRPMAGWGK